jgi:hypothetical protein
MQVRAAMMRDVVTVYMSIGNSDDKLTQAEWSEFYVRMAAEVASYASQIHGTWFSNPVGRWQNACWCLEFASEAAAKTARDVAAEIREEYRQDSVAWAEVPVTQFI